MLLRATALFVCALAMGATALAQNSVVVGAFGQETSRAYTTADGLPDNDVARISVDAAGAVIAEGVAGWVVVFDGTQWTRDDARKPVPPDYDGPESIERELTCRPARAASGWLAVGTLSGLRITSDETGDDILVSPADATRSWDPKPIKAVAFDSLDRLWFASPQGVGVLDEKGWSLYDGHDGLPYNDFTSAAGGADGSIWFGTTKGAIHFDGKHWAYRQGKRWLPSDEVRSIAVNEKGDAFFATPAGVGVIRRVPMTLKEKAAHYETLIDKYHRRTPYGFVIEAYLKEPGKIETAQTGDSDNDGLWTSMYGAGECFAYAATKDPKAKERADKAFDAMEFLGKVSQGGSHPAPKGYVARTVLPTSGPNPNDGRIEGDREEQKSDKLWKVIDPRWPVSEDGKWYWKSDTSSDELDGHFFFYGLYYDLVAESDEEKERVRRHVSALAGHLVDHGFNLVDHDGLPTRWGQYGPKEMNFDESWFVERGLNSLSIIAYLTIAEHITGEKRFGDAKRELIEKHGYAQNLMHPKFQRGIGTGNQSDDEMAFMNYYGLMKYETDPKLRERVALSWWHYWRLEEPELNPFFNFAFASMCMDGSFENTWGRVLTEPGTEWLGNSVDMLKRFPLDLTDWGVKNSHRLDIVPLPGWMRDYDHPSVLGRGLKTNGLCLPVDERQFHHWNTDPFRLDDGGNGHSLADGTIYLLPYYMGLYHGFVTD